MPKNSLCAKVIAMEKEITTEQFSPVNIEERRKLDFKAGDTVRVWSKILEKGKIRLQAFEGLVLSRKHGLEPGATFTVRRVASGVGVERIFPLYSPNIEKIEILKKSKTRRNKLYFIREKAVKEVRKMLKSITLTKEEQEEAMGVTDEEEVKEEKIETTEVVEITETVKTENLKEETEKQEAPEEENKEKVKNEETEETEDKKE